MDMNHTHTHSLSLSLSHTRTHTHLLTFLATSSELLTASALGSNSPKNRVKAVSTAVIRPREAEGKYSVAVATKRAVLREEVDGRDIILCQIVSCHR